MKNKILVFILVALMFITGCGDVKNKYSINDLSGSWKYTDDSGVYTISVTVKDDDNALVIVKKGYETPMWTFNNCIFDAEENTLIPDTGEYVVTLLDEYGNTSIYDAEGTVFKFENNTCTWSDSVKNFGKHILYIKE